MGVPPGGRGRAQDGVLTVTELFTRAGVLHTGPVQTNDKGKPSYTYMPPCGRCGGAGRSDRWAYTGYTCYQCGGRGHCGEAKSAPLYTREQLEKLGEAAGKRRAKKAAEVAAMQAQRAAEADARRQAFLDEHADLLARMRRFAAFEDEPPRSEFIDDVYRRALTNSAITDGQIAAAVKAMDAMDAEDARKAAASHLGEIGGKVAFTATVKRVLCLGQSRFNYLAHNWLIALRTGDGCSVSYIGSRCYDLVEGDEVKVQATVKNHRRYRDEPETVICRPKFEIVQGEVA
jgi:hypothetical protein